MVGKPSNLLENPRERNFNPKRSWQIAPYQAEIDGIFEIPLKHRVSV